MTNEDAVQAAAWSQWIEPLQDDDWPHRELRLGFDTQARPLETVVLIFDSGEESQLCAVGPMISHKINALICRVEPSRAIHVARHRRRRRMVAARRQ